MDGNGGISIALGIQIKIGWVFSIAYTQGFQLERYKGMESTLQQVLMFHPEVCRCYPTPSLIPASQSALFLVHQSFWKDFVSLKGIHLQWMCSSLSPQQIHEEIQELPWALAFPKSFSRHPLDCCCCSALQPRGSKDFAFPFTGSSSCLPHGPNSPHLEEAQGRMWVSAKVRQSTPSLSQFTY